MDILLTAEIQNLMAFMSHLWGLWGFVELNPFCIFLEVLIDVLRGLWNTFKRLFEKNAADGGGVQCKNLPDSCCSSEEEAASGNATAEPWLKWIAMDL